MRQRWFGACLNVVCLPDSDCLSSVMLLLVLLLPYLVLNDDATLLSCKRIRRRRATKEEPSREDPSQNSSGTLKEIKRSRQRKGRKLTRRGRKELHIVTLLVFQFQP